MSDVIAQVRIEVNRLPSGRLHMILISGSGLSSIRVPSFKGVRISNFRMYGLRVDKSTLHSRVYEYLQATFECMGCDKWTPRYLSIRSYKPLISKDSCRVLRTK